MFFMLNLLRKKFVRNQVSDSVNLFLNAIDYASKTYAHFFPTEQKPRPIRVPIKLALEEDAKATLPKYIAEAFPNKPYSFEETSFYPKKEKTYQVGFDDYQVVDVEKGKPFIESRDCSGLIVLMRSVNSLGLANVSFFQDSFERALQRMIERAQGAEIELFFLGNGDTVQSKLDQVVQHVQVIVNQSIVIKDNLVRSFDFEVTAVKKKPEVKFAGFDEGNHPIAIIGYQPTS